MASSFPGAIDSFTTKVDGVDDVMAAHVNDLQESVVSVETILQMMMTGWVPDQDTWVYVSATSFKIVGKDVRSKFPTGIKLKCTDGGSTKYFYGIGAAMSGSDTLVTITGGSDYSLSGGAITNPHYSYASKPQGFPNYFNYIPDQTGYSTIPPNGVYGFYMESSQVTLSIYQPNDGVSNSTLCRMTIPVVNSPIPVIAAIQARNNSTTITVACLAQISANANYISFYTSYSGAGWTDSGNKRVPGCTITYFAR